MTDAQSRKLDVLNQCSVFVRDSAPFPRRGYHTGESRTAYNQTWRAMTPVLHIPCSTPMYGVAPVSRLWLGSQTAANEENAM